MRPAGGVQAVPPVPTSAAIARPRSSRRAQAAAQLYPATSVSWVTASSFLTGLSLSVGGVLWYPSRGCLSLSSGAEFALLGPCCPGLSCPNPLCIRARKAAPARRAQTQMPGRTLLFAPVHHPQPLLFNFFVEKSARKTKSRLRNTRA